LEATNDLVAITDHDRRWVYLNRAGRRLLGFGEHDDVSDTTMEASRPEWARTRFLNEAIPTAEREGIWIGEGAFMGPDGVEFPTLDVLLVRRGPDGAVDSYSTVARDISHLKQVEAQLLRAQRLETAGRIAGQVAHDFN